MEDRGHVRDAERLQREIYRGMSPANRLRQAVRMHQQMRSLMDAALRAQHPGWSAEQRNACIAERILYGRTG